MNLFSEITDDLTPLDEPVLTPPLKWAGGKRWLVPTLIKLLAKKPYTRLVEPFVGGMAVALGLLPSKALLNDANPHLINFYQQIKKGLVIETPMKNDKEFFYEVRTKFNDLLTPTTAAHQQQSAEFFYYLNRTAFNGLCRFNSKGQFNVPFGKYSKINYTTDFSKYKVLFGGWDFTCGDFTRLKIEKGDFLYVDPPYDTQFTKYSKEDFKWEDQIRLVEWLQTVPSSAMLAVSNQATERVVELYKSKGYTITTVMGPRRISSNGDRTPCEEMLALRNF